MFLTDVCRCSGQSGPPHRKAGHKDEDGPCMMCPCIEYRELETVDTHLLRGVKV